MSQKIKLWDIETHTDIATFDEPVFSIDSIVFSPDGKTLVSVSSTDGIVKVWDLETGSAIDLGHTRIGRWTGNHAISFSPDSTTLASGAHDGTIKLWDVVTGTNIANLLGERQSWVTRVVFSPDGRTIASRASGEKFTRLWDVVAQTTIAKLEGKSVIALTFSPNGKIFAHGASDSVKLWDVATMQNIATLEGHTKIIRSLAFSPNGQILVSGASDYKIKLWDITTRQNIATFTHTGGGYGVDFVTFLSDESILASRVPESREVPESVKLWHVPAQTLITTFEMSPVVNNLSIAYSSDGTLMLKNFQRAFSLWDATTLTLIATLEGFSANGKTFASNTHTHNMILLGDIETVDRMVNTPTDFFLSVK